MLLIMFHTRNSWGVGGKKKEKVLFLVQVKADFFCYTIVTDYFSNMLIFPGAIAFYD